MLWQSLGCWHPCPAGQAAQTPPPQSTPVSPSSFLPSLHMSAPEEEDEDDDDVLAPPTPPLPALLEAGAPLLELDVALAPPPMPPPDAEDVLLWLEEELALVLAAPPPPPLPPGLPVKSKLPRMLVHADIPSSVTGTAGNNFRVLIEASLLTTTAS